MPESAITGGEGAEKYDGPPICIDVTEIVTKFYTESKNRPELIALEFFLKAKSGILPVYVVYKEKNQPDFEPQEVMLRADVAAYYVNAPGEAYLKPVEGTSASQDDMSEDSYPLKTMFEHYADFLGFASFSADDIRFMTRYGSHKQILLSGARVDLGGKSTGSRQDSDYGHRSVGRMLFTLKLEVVLSDAKGEPFFPNPESPSAILGKPCPTPWFPDRFKRKAVEEFLKDDEVA